MPIRPEMKARYPKDWPDIRARILDRAGHKCERCAVPNYVYRWTEADGDHWTEDLMRVEVLTTCDGVKVSRIVLTIAHVHDPDPSNCADENLQALCQRCHNRLDMPMRQRNSAKTRKAGKACRDLLDEPQA